MRPFSRAATTSSIERRSRPTNPKQDTIAFEQRVFGAVSDMAERHCAAARIGVDLALDPEMPRAVGKRDALCLAQTDAVLGTEFL